MSHKIKDKNKKYIEQILIDNGITKDYVHWNALYVKIERAVEDALELGMDLSAAAGVGDPE